MYEPHRPHPFAALCVLCLALCADPALAGATGGWGEGAGPAQPDTPPSASNPKLPPRATGKYWPVTASTGETIYFTDPEAALDYVFRVRDKKSGEYVKTSCGMFSPSSSSYVCNYEKRGGGGGYGSVISPVENMTSCPKGMHVLNSMCTTQKCSDGTLPKNGICPIESGGGGDFGGGGASGDWEEDPKKPDEDKEDQKEDPKDPDPDFGDLGDIPKPPIPPPTPPASGPNVNVGVGVNVPGPCTGAAAGTVGCMKPGAPSGEVPKPRNVDAGKDVGTRPVSSIKGCPDPRTFDFWGERYELSYDMLCQKAPIVKSFVMFSSSLSGFLMMLSVFRRK